MIQVANNIWRGPYMPPPLIPGEIDCTLDLETGAHWAGDESPLTESLAGESVGIRVFPHPLGTLLPPTTKELKSAIRFLRHFSSKKGIYVHCHHGVDRTGMVCAAYRIIAQGWTPWRAAKEMIDLGFHWYFYFYWIPQLWRLK